MSRVTTTLSKQCYALRKLKNIVPTADVASFEKESDREPSPGTPEADILIVNFQKIPTQILILMSQKRVTRRTKIEDISLIFLHSRNKIILVNSQYFNNKQIYIMV